MKGCCCVICWMEFFRFYFCFFLFILKSWWKDKLLKE
jgi:hypothetical protein